MMEDRTCLACGKLLTRRINGKSRESIRDFKRRQYCGRSCAAKHQHNEKPPETASEIKKAAEMAEKGDESEKKTAIEILEEAANNKKLDWVTRINAAKALAPYQAKRKGEAAAGKKEEREEAAKKASTGRFAAGPAPKVVSISQGSK